VCLLQLAAARYARYWDKRVEIFGPDKAFQPLKLAAALCGDSVALERGFFSITGTKDSSGRSIMVMDPSKHDKTMYERESMCRALWYVVHAGLEDEMTQKRGLVILGYLQNAKFSQFDRALTKMNIESLKGCIPVRMSGLHLCHAPSFMALVLPVVKVFMGERMRKRIQLHSGSNEKVLKKVSPYGLSKEAMPTYLGGDQIVDYQSWLEQRRVAGL
jgi:hypothetical protein